MFDLELKIQPPDHSRPQAVWFFQSHVIYSIVKPHSYYPLIVVVPFIEFLRANHLKLALNDHVAPGVDLEIQKTRHVPVFEQLATKWQPQAGALWYRQQCQSPAPSHTPWCFSQEILLRPCALSATPSHSCDTGRGRDEKFSQYHQWDVGYFKAINEGFLPSPAPPLDKSSKQGTPSFQGFSARPRCCCCCHE